MILCCSCNKPVEPNKTICANSISKQNHIQKEEYKPFANPALMYGADFLNFFSTLKMSNPDNIDTLLAFTSTQSKILHSRASILNLFIKTNINFRKKLKSIKKINDILYVLNYSASKFATTELVTCSVLIEQDTAKFILPENLNDFLK